MVRVRFHSQCFLPNINLVRVSFGVFACFLFCSLAEAGIFTQRVTVSSNSSVDINFNETLLDPASLAYHFIFSTNDSDTLVLNVSAFWADDFGGARLLIALENVSDAYGDPAVVHWQNVRIDSWSGPCVAGSLLTSNSIQIHIIIYELIQQTRISLQATVCSSLPCLAKKAKSISPYTCLPSRAHSHSVSPRAFHSLVSLNSCYYAFGGVSSISPSEDLPPLYTLISQANCTNSPLKNGQYFTSKRYLASIIPALPRIFILGGIIKNSNSTDGFVSYGSSASWSPMPTLELFGHAGCALSTSRLYVYGGSTFDGQLSSLLIQWRQKWGEWRNVTAWYGSPPPPLFGHTLTCSPDTSTLYLYGGFTLNSAARLTANPTVFVFDTVLKRWATVVTTIPRFFHSAAFLPAKYSDSSDISNGGRVLAIFGGRLSSTDVGTTLIMVDTYCSTTMKLNTSSPLPYSLGAGAASVIAPLSSDPYFRLLSSGGLIGFNGTSILDATPYDLKVKLPVITKRCPSGSSPPTDLKINYWRCGLALNPTTFANPNVSRFIYDVPLPNSNEMTFFVDVDALANTLSALTSASMEWTVQCRGWLRMDSMSGLGLTAAYKTSSGNIVKRALNFRFAIYLFVDGNVVQTYIPSGNFAPPTQPLLDSGMDYGDENNENGIYDVSLFFHGFGPIVPSGSSIQLQSSKTGATYLMPTSMLSATAAELACGSVAAQISCVACLLNAACSWQPGSPGYCVPRRNDIPTSDGDGLIIDVIRDPSACPSCFLNSVFCRQCVSPSDSCAWVPSLDLCLPEVVTLSIPEATTSCPMSCASRKSCSACTDNSDTDPRCIWCPTTGKCIDYWVAEAGIPAAVGCTLGCPIPDTTTPLPPPTTTVCAADKSWCGTPNDICVKIMAANGMRDATSTLPPNPVDAFPLMRDDDNTASNSDDSLMVMPTIDARMLLINMNPNIVCAGHGHCIPPGRCQCDQFWQGSSCERSCNCYGDAVCPDPAKPDYCLCPAGTTGTYCERCLGGYTGSPKNGVPCRSCSQVCNNNADTCVSLAAVKQSNLTGASLSTLLASKLPVPEQDADILCIGCRDNTIGNLCQSCTSGYFRPAMYGRVDLSAKCRPCMCNDHGTFCQENGGYGCQCEDNTRTAYGASYTLGCASCTPPFLGDPRNGRPCYLPVSQNQQLCLWQDSVPNIAAKLVAAVNSSDSSTICRHVRDSVLLPGSNMHLASQIPIANELRIFLGVVSGHVDVVMTLNPSGLRPAPKNMGLTRTIRAATISTFNNGYDKINEIKATQNNNNDPSGDSVAFVSRSQLAGAPVAIRYVSGRLLIVVSPPADRLKQGDEISDSTDSNANQNQAIVFYLRITAVTASTVRTYGINDNGYYSYSAGEATAGDTAAGVVVFRQDQVQIDVFVFFSVFLALFVLLLLALLLVIRFHAVLGERRRLRVRQQRKRAMIKRPFGISWPRFDLPLLLNPVTKLPIKVTELLAPPVSSNATPRSVSNTKPAKQEPPSRRTATIVSLQPTGNNLASIVTVLIKLPVSRPVMRQLSTASGFNIDEQTAIVTSVPPPPMAFGTFIMRVTFQEPKKAPSGRKSRLVSPAKPGRPRFERDFTDESLADEPIRMPVIVPPLNLNSLPSAAPNQRRQSEANTATSRYTPSSVTLPPTPDTVISSRSGGDDLEEALDEIISSNNIRNIGRRLFGGARRQSMGAVVDGNGRARPMAASNRRATNRVVAAPVSEGQPQLQPHPPNRSRQPLQQTNSQPAPPRPQITVHPPDAPVPQPPLPAAAQPSTSNEATTPSTSRTSDSVLIPELPDTLINSRRPTNRRGLAGIFGRGRVVANAVAQRPPLPPTALAARQATAIGRRRSVPAQQNRQSITNAAASTAAPNSVHSEED